MRNTKLIALLLTLLLLIPGVGWATCSNSQTPAVTTACTSGATTCNVTVTSVPSGHSVVVWSSSIAASITISSVCDGGGCPGSSVNTYVHCTGCNGSDATGGASSDIFYDLVTTGSSGTTIVVTRSASGSLWTSGVYDVTCSGTPVLDASGSVDDSTLTNPLNGVGLTLAGTNDFIVQIISTSTSQLSSISGGYTIDGGGNQRKSASLFNTTAGGAPQWTLLANARAAASAVAIRDNQPPATGGHNSMLPTLGVGN